MQRIYLFDWGDTLMVDIPGMTGKMCDWPKVESTPRAGETLECLSAQGSAYIATAAAESSPEDIRKAFERVGLDTYIKGYFCRQNTGHTKPDPAFYQAVTRHLGVAPGQVTMVGDSLEKDILPCHTLGFKTVWLCCGQDGSAPHGARIINDLGELCKP